MVGRTISHYRIVAELGAGGMGVVYRAEDVRLGREVAVKFVSQDYMHEQQALERLRSEARAASALNHPNICTIYDVGEDEGRPFIVMELMKGATLRERVDHGRLKVHQIVDLAIEIADALHSTHSDGIIHRDIKPGNIFLTDRGHVKLLDFGLAKQTPRYEQASASAATMQRTAMGVALGTIFYMSPEQATGEVLDARTDIFSLGVVLYECATGQHPFAGSTTTITLASILNKAPTAPMTLNPDLPVRLQEIINNCLEKDRELRYQSAADLRADLKRLRRDLDSGHSNTVETVIGPTLISGAQPARTVAAPLPSGSTPPDSPSTGSAAATGGRKWLLAALGGAVVAAGAIGTYVLSQPAAPPAQITAPIPAFSDNTVQNRLALATASFQAHNYRAALAYASEVLAIDGGNAEAAKIRNEAQAMLVKFDAAIAEARRHLEARDIQNAARSLEAARQLDAASPSVIELSARLAEATRERQPATRDLAGLRAPVPPPPPGRVAPPPPSTSISVAPSPQAAPTPTPAPAPPPAAIPAPAPALPAPPPPPEPVAPKPAPPAAPVAEPRTAPVAPMVSAAPDSAEQEEAAIRRLTQNYAKAIESKDLALFRSIKPNLSREEERRLQEGFRAVTSQRVTVTIMGIDRRGDDASVTLRRRDTIQVGGRQQTSDSQQTLRVHRTSNGWVILEIR